ncbi:MAG: hypothetical protein AVDCRST_MAG59-3767 [uncultured Thermomicrobiales bacterium]|uniref:Uncharacterized protein n=1 Tax=uncultured Thermomicrobiales bacterium TaxID=1645740 RepID=A0A6J4VGS7_9BACT|nr:MAG: hypothetical protein AVDCRST_MAG59-3767 [uncultured Thermomicrobiales bacterium]
MSGYTNPSREDDPVHTVRTIARVAQMLVELRDEYVDRPRPDLLVQIDQRLQDLEALRTTLRQRTSQVQSRDS